MKKITLGAFMVTLFSVSFLSAQKATLQSQSLQAPDGTIKCASEAYNQAILSQNPNMMGSDYFENQLAENILEVQNNANRGATPIRIPVVVHIVHNGEGIGTGSNISELQVLSQITVLNEDYRRIPGTRGFGAGVDTNIEFFLAKEDPDCNPTDGINRVLRSSLPNGGADIDGDIKPNTIWDPSIYLNMWVTQLGGGLLGYAQFPGGPPETDGVVMGYQYFGSNDAAGVTLGGVYNLGRTTTHEVGHYLGLFHTFQGGCTGAGDSVADTPPQAQPNYGCPAVPPDTCAGGDDDPIENYMDYSDDVCMDMFTAGQNTRMQGVLAGSRLALANSPVTDTDLPPVSDDGSIKILSIGSDCGDTVASIRISNFGTNTLTSATINYDVNGGTNQTYPWSGSLAEGESTTVDISGINGTGGTDTLNASIVITNTDLRVCNDSDSETFVAAGASTYDTTQVHLTLITDNYGSETTWQFLDSGNTVIASGGPYANNTTYNESFNVSSNECYSFIINDSYGDGICCGFGNGSYELKTDDDTVIVSGGDFGSSETTQIAVETLSVGEFFLNNNVSIFPNPVNSELNIKLGDTNNLPDSFEIYNVLGQSVLQKSISSNADLTLDASNFSNGVYFIKIAKEDSSLTLRFIKR